MVSFIWGGNTGIATPEELAHRRRAARDMIRSSTEQVAQNPWEGLAQIARAISGNYADYRAGQEEEKGRASAHEAYRPIAEAMANKTSPTGEQINAALSNPWMNDGQKMIAQQLFKNQYGDGDQTKYGRNPIWGTDEQGNTVVFQLPQSGGAPQRVQFPKGFKPTPGVSY